ncbi:hypothetical protein B0H13DRAFT_2655389 [Mycena leptocephala]|nr:hypothetical protein B0H13DRAFT_2655389 [Mycena leptocephala]
MLSVFRDSVYRAIPNRSPCFSIEVAPLDLTGPLQRIRSRPIHFRILLYKSPEYRLSAIFSSRIMLVAAPKFFVLLSIGFAAALPVLPSTEPASKNSVSIPLAQLVSIITDTAPHLNTFRDKSRALKVVDTVPNRHGNQIFASEQWERSLPSSRVRQAREPESTIFNHNQWENPDLDDTSPRSTSLIFAHSQWEEQDVAEENDLRKTLSTRRHAEHEVRDEVNIFEYQQWERRDSVFEEVGRVDAEKRKDISTGPVFFAHVQWEE